ncbi:ABC transporter permease [Bartonella tamiae]|uniref:ABC transporter permease n=1 Tax=Bartonella tamiae TaxID=373638 RepID=UPI00026E8305|nr:ABC transporter permease [Bartonella tamiae]EJF93140.1 hypothetical protein MEG_01354 [Bartonella tamiae Th307]
MTVLNEMILALRFALREMRAGLKGFYIFLACIALGVGAIGGVNGISRSVGEEMTRQGQALLAGDIRFRLVQRPANDNETTFMQAIGQVSQSTHLRSMARRIDTNDQTMVELKAVDTLYPLYGTLKTTPQLNTKKLFAKKGDSFGTVAPKLLLNQLQLNIGDTINVGDLKLTITAILDEEPDLLSEGFLLGPRLMISQEALMASNLIQPGSLHTYFYRIYAPQLSDTELAVLKEKAQNNFIEMGLSIRTRDNAAPGLSKNIERFTQFLTLIGLTALIVGGVGVANAVRTYMDEKRSVIATFKSLGAKKRMIMEMYFFQIMIISLIGIVIGLFLAAFIPFLASELLRNYLPFLGGAHLYPSALIMAIIFALLITSSFALLPLANAQATPVTALLRSFDTRRPEKQKLALFIVMLLLVITTALAIYQSYDRRMAVIFILAVCGAFLVLRIVSIFIQFLARKSVHVQSTALRLAIGNIYRPGALTPSVVLALGLGLTLLVALATIDGNLRNQLSTSVPETAPDFFFMDIARDDADAFSSFVKEQDPEGRLRIMPTLRARITKLNDVPAQDATVHPDSAWVLRGDRNITYAEKMPEDTSLIEGKWWNENENDRPKVSLSQPEGRELGLKLGDTITVNVLGQDITATITSFRHVDWDSLNMNFVMIFSPKSLKGAPHVWLSTLKTNPNNAFDDAKFMRDISKEFPSVTVVSVRQVIADAQVLVGQIGIAIRASASIALIASILVLAGALSAGNSARAYDAVVLKTLGATRKVLIKAFIYEYTLLGLATAIFSFLAGSFAGWSIARYKMELTNATILAGTGIGVIAIALILSVGFGLIGTWKILGRKPSQYLKDL